MDYWPSSLLCAQGVKGRWAKHALPLFRPPNSFPSLRHCASAQALAAFKRTHEQDSMAALRAMVADEDAWDALQAAMSSGSGAMYFT
jgi:hypothetical protein